MSRMCPDRQLLSVYFDGELPSPWKEKMEAHIKNCPECSKQLEAYTSIHRARAEESEPVMEAARQRIWQNLEQRLGYSSSPQRTILRDPRQAAWRRSIRIPIPAAAAAIVLFAVLAFLLALRINSTTELSGITFASEAELDTPGIIPVSDMADVLQYLDGRDNGDIIILRLPESRSFVNYGEPAMIKASDYSRNVSNRNIIRGRKP